MTRTSSILSLILAALAIAVAAVPAAADPGYQTDAFLGPHPAVPSTTSGDTPAWSGDAKDLYVQALSPSQPAPVRTTEVTSDGFNLGDALVGALIASGLLMGTLAVARSVARRRRVTA